MLFKFLKYISPTNYFNLIRKDSTSVFPDYNSLPKKVKKQIVLDTRFTSEAITLLDASWQAIHKGYIGEAKTINFDVKPSLLDEYIFIRKYYNSLWVFYTLFMRIILFNNPFKELLAFYKSKGVKRFALYKDPINYNDWHNYESKLLEVSPKVSVVIPTLNRYEYLKDVLKDLEKQVYINFDVIIVDQSEPFDPSFYEDYNLDLKVTNQKEKALWLARNFAIKSSDADYFLLFDDDSRVEPDWITNHLKCLDYFDANISSGTSISVIGAKVPESYSYFKISEQLDTGNVLIKRNVFEKIGLFDRQFEKQRMGDGEYGLRAFLTGFKNISNPYSERLHLKVGTGGLRQMGSWDGFRPKKWFSPRPIPSVVYLFRKYFGNELTIFSILRTVPPALIPYRFKGNSKMIFIGYLILMLLFPIIFLQVYRSWRFASIKLSEGALISKL